jgi:hypothetical protein
MGAIKANGKSNCITATATDTTHIRAKRFGVVQGSIKSSITTHMINTGTFQVAVGSRIKVFLCDAGVPASVSDQHSFKTDR